MFFNKSREKVLVMLDADSIMELDTENIKPISITYKGDTHPHKIIKGEVILTEQQMKEIWKNL